MTSLEEKGFLLEIDTYFSKRMLDPYPLVSENVRVFLSVLMAFSRQGHLCLSVKEGALEPSLKQWISDKQECEKIEEQVIQGAGALPSDLVQREDHPLGEPLFKSKPIVHFSTFYYLQKNWVFETNFLRDLCRLHRTPPKTWNLEGYGIVFPSSEDTLKRESIKFIPEQSLNVEQQKAVLLALEGPFTLITGGPGTGKTYTAAHIVKCFLDQFPKKEREKMIVYAAAPTGKAAAHLKKNLLRYLPMQQFTCGTLHRLLNVKDKKGMSEKTPPLFADLILIDECSMIDAALFSLLLSSLKTTSKVILMGDPYQLPPVETGSFFSDLVDIAKSGFLLPCAELCLCMRFEKKELLCLAEAIKKTEVEKALGQITHFKQNETGILHQNDVKKAHGLLWEKAKDHFIFGEELSPTSPDILKRMDQFRILCSLRQGPYGVDALNEMIASRLWDHTREGKWVFFPILLTRSMASLNLANGETGVLACRRTASPSIQLLGEENVAIFWDEEGSIRQVPVSLLPSFEYAFCISIHKGQGSEYDEVLLLIPPGTEIFGREVLYTAITRARQRLCIEGEETIIREAISRSSRKISGLKERVNFLH